MCDKKEIEQAEPEETTAQARLDALLDWLTNQVGCNSPIRIKKEASRDLSSTDDPALQWVLEQLTKPKIQITVGPSTSIEDYLASLYKYVYVVEGLLESAFRDEISWAEEVKLELSDGDAYAFEEDFALVQWQFSTLFPRVFRYSLFVTSFTLLEYHLEQLCECHRNLERISLKYNEIYGRGGLERYQTYLKKVVGLEEEFPDRTDTWKNILVYQELRNIIVHDDGLIHNSFGKGQNGKDKKERKVLSFIDARDSISLSEFSHVQKRIQLGRSFCLEFLDTLKDFFGNLLLL